MQNSKKWVEISRTYSIDITLKKFPVVEVSAGLVLEDFLPQVHHIPSSATASFTNHLVSAMFKVT